MLQKLIKLGLIAFFLFVLCWFAYVGTNSRLMADDYCSATIVRQKGLFPSVVYWYNAWSGRFSATFLDSLTGLIGPAANIWSPTLVITAWFLGLAVSARRLGYHWLEALLLGALLPALVLLSAPDVGQSLYWSQGMHSVLPPLILFSLIFTAPWPWLAGLLAFLAGGFGETYSIVQLTLLALMLFYFLHRLPRRRFFSIALISAVLAFLITLAAPGNAVRRAVLPPPPGLVEYFTLLGSSISTYLSKTFVQYWYIVLGIFLLGWVVQMPFNFDQKKLRWIAIGTPVLMFAVLIISFAPGVYLLHEPLANRTQMIPHFFFMLGLLIEGQVIGMLRPNQPHWALAACAVILLIIAIHGTLTIRQSQVDIKQYARRWDQAYQAVIDAKNSGSQSILLPHNNNPIIYERNVDWIEACMSDYYSIQIERDK